MVLRAADGEVLADVDSDAVRQEIDGFTARVGYEGAHTVQIVDPVGRLSRPARVDHRIQLEQAQ